MFYEQMYKSWMNVFLIHSIVNTSSYFFISGQRHTAPYKVKLHLNNTKTRIKKRCNHNNELLACVHPMNWLKALKGAYKDLFRYTFLANEIFGFVLLKLFKSLL